MFTLHDSEALEATWRATRCLLVPCFSSKLVESHTPRGMRARILTPKGAFLLLPLPEREKKKLEIKLFFFCLTCLWLPPPSLTQFISRTFLVFFFLALKQHAFSSFFFFFLALCVQTPEKKRYG